MNLAATTCILLPNNFISVRPPQMVGACSASYLHFNIFFLTFYYFSPKKCVKVRKINCICVTNDTQINYSGLANPSGNYPITLEDFLNILKRRWVECTSYICTQKTMVVSDIPPVIAPAMRGPSVYNTEVFKNCPPQAAWKPRWRFKWNTIFSVVLVNCLRSKFHN